MTRRTKEVTGGVNGDWVLEEVALKWGHRFRDEFVPVGARNGVDFSQAR